MTWIDWTIVVVPIAILIWISFYSGKYARSAVDYLAAGRVAGRYVLAVGGMEGSLSVITLVALTEQNYQTGYAVSFWGMITAPVGIFIALTGFCVYRWRETRCLSFGQFIELRYGSKFFRVFCACLRVLAESITNAIGPAIAANFFIYYLGLPHKIMICGINLPCYSIVVTLCIALAILFIWPSGRISLLITDCFQGLISYPIFVIFVGYIILEFSWTGDIAPVMWNRVEGQSFMNPYDISKLRDFNLFALVVSLCGSILNRASWIGNDNSGVAKSAHEQKMAALLGAWRNGFALMLTLLVAIVVIVFMNSPHFTKKNRLNVTSTEIRQQMTDKILAEVMDDEVKHAQVMAEVKAVPAGQELETARYIQEYGSSPEKLARLRFPSDPEAHVELMRETVEAAKTGKEIPAEFANTLIQKPLSQQDNSDTPYFDCVREGLGDTPEGRYQFQKFRALYNQMMMPSLLRRIFPTGMLGLFCLLMIMLLVSTDDGRIFNSSATIAQDMILPLFKGRLSPEKHLLILRLTTLGVGILFWVFSMFFAQLDYINMFTTIMCSLWLGGAGPIMVMGLYSRFGNLTGAWCSIIFGSGTSLVGVILQRSWALHVYPFLERMGWVNGLDAFLRTVSSPFDPWIVWVMDPVKFPINSYEIYFISMMLSLGGYVVGSYLTYKPYDLDKLLHRGKYSDGQEVKREAWTLRNVFRKIIGITPEYSKGDRIIAYSVFYYTFVYNVLITFLLIAIWNAIIPWPHEWWTVKFFITSLLVPGLIGIVSTVWFMWGGIRDSRQLFIDLEKRVEDPEDNGQIIN